MYSTKRPKIPSGQSMEYRHMLEQPKTIAKINDASRLKLLFLKMVGQYGSQTRVKIENNLVRVWKLRHPVERQPVQKMCIVDFSDITFVVVASETCVRIGIGERLLTASGENAKKLLAWARACGQERAGTTIPMLPSDIMFDRSNFGVCVRDGELAFA